VNKYPQVNQDMKRLWLSLLLIGFVALDAIPSLRSARSQDAQREEAKKRTQIVMLGTGTPNADPERFGPSVAIVVDETPYLVDMGAGVVRRASAAFKKGVKALEASNLATVFVTHLHSDHTVGYPDLIFTPWVLERAKPLDVYGPKGLKSMTEHLLKAYQEDIAIRTTGGEPSKKTDPIVIPHEIKPGVVYKDQKVTVKAFLVNHGAWKDAFGYRFETPDRTIVISGDASPSQSIADNCNGCDVLIHEVYSLEGFAKRPPEWQKYHSTFHTSSRDLGELATKAKAKMIILYHQLIWGSTEEELLKEVRQTFKGEVVSARDLDIY
jgi:ribonuclease BN (tRNA processing enzyme)